MNWRDNLERLKTLRTNWDSYGAAEIDSRVICRVKMLMLFMEELDLDFPIMLPNVRGGIDLQWDKFDLTIHPGPRFEYCPENPEVIENFYVSLPRAYSLILKHLGEK